MSLLNMSLTGGVFILAVLFIRTVFQNIVPRRTFLVLWLVACALLLIPLRFRLPVSFYSLFRQTEVAAPTTAVQVSSTVVEGTPARSLPWWQIVWLLGSAALLLTVLISHGRNLWHFRKAVPVEPHPEELPRWVRVKSLPGLPSPLVCGIIHPTVLIPGVDCATPEQLRHIYLHELCHIRHLDVLRRYLMLFVLAVHWFNPVVWIMYYVASQDMEMRCDEQTILQLGAKKAYAVTLVAMETGKLQHLLDAGFSFSSTGSRLKAILKARRLPFISIALALALCISAVAVFATDANVKDSEMETRVSVDMQPQPEPESESESEPETEAESQTGTEPDSGSEPEAVLETVEVPADVKIVIQESAPADDLSNTDSVESDSTDSETETAPDDNDYYDYSAYIASETETDYDDDDYETRDNPDQEWINALTEQLESDLRQQQKEYERTNQEYIRQAEQAAAAAEDQPHNWAYGPDIHWNGNDLYIQWAP